MKKMNLLLMIIFGMVLFMPIHAKALTGEISIECGKKELVAGESTTCKIYATPSGGNSTGVDGKYSVTDGLEITKMQLESASVADIDTDDQSFAYVLNDASSSKFQIGTLTVKASSSVTTSTEIVTISEAYIYDDAATPAKIEMENGTATIKIVQKTESTTTTATTKKKTKKVAIVENPKTADLNIVVSALIIVVASIITVICYRKYRKVK